VNPSLTAAIPFVLVPALLLSGRAGALLAGVAGLLATVAALVLLRGASASTLALFEREALSGCWLAVQAVAFIIGGLFFYRCVRASEPGLFSSSSEADDASLVFDRRKLFAACFLVGPFAESATGFGVGMIIALPLIVAARARGLTALALSLLSQSLVAWGSLGVGSAIGASLASVPFQALANHSAWLEGPVLVGHLLVFWLLLTADGHRPTLVEALDDLLWTILLAGALVAATALIAPELGGLIATGSVFVVRSLRDEPGLVTRLPRALRSTWPYVLLTAILVTTRTVPAFRNALQHLAPIRPLPDQPALAPFYHPATWLITIGLVALVVTRSKRSLGAVLGEVTRSGWRPVLVTVVYVVLARLVAGGGLAADFAHGAQQVAGREAIYLAPMFGALSGFLTGSNTASNGMMMPVQAALAHAAGADVAWTSAMQNVSGSTLSMLSPARIATGCALLGLVGQDRAGYAKAWPFGAVALLILSACWVILA